MGFEHSQRRSMPIDSETFAVRGELEKRPPGAYEHISVRWRHAERDLRELDQEDRLGAVPLAQPDIDFARVWPAHQGLKIARPGESPFEHREVTAAISGEQGVQSERSRGALRLLGGRSPARFNTWKQTKAAMIAVPKVIRLGKDTS